MELNLSIFHVNLLDLIFKANFIMDYFYDELVDVLKYNYSLLEIKIESEFI